MRKIRIIAFVLTSLSMTSAYAGEGTVAVNGYVNMQYGTVDQKKPFRRPIPGGDRPYLIQSGLFSDSEVHINYENNLECLCIKYGATIKVYSNPTPAPNGATNFGKSTYVWTETPYGKIEIGSKNGVSIDMKRGAEYIAVATGGIDGDFGYYNNPYTIDGFENQTLFIASPQLTVGYDSPRRANKINYYSPKLGDAKEYGQVQIGVSFTPDIEIRGTVYDINDVFADITPVTGIVPVRNILELGLDYDIEYCDIKSSTGIVAQFGQSKAFVNEDHRRDLRAWEIGDVITYKEFSVAGSYGNWGRSGTSVNTIPGNKYGAHYYTLGGAYTLDDFASSITYMNSKRAGGSLVRVNPANGKVIFSAAAQEPSFNGFQAVSVGMQYNICKGIMPYAEWTHFIYDRIQTPVDNRGHVIILGLKVSF